MMLPNELLIGMGLAGLVLYIVCDIMDDTIIPMIKKKYFSPKDKNKEKETIES